MVDNPMDDSVQKEEPTIRLLNNDEFTRIDLLKIFEEEGFTEPDPHLCKVIVAEDKEKNIVGLYLTRPVFHAEPMWVREDYRSSLLCVRLGKALLKLYEHFKGLELFAFAHRKEITKALSKGGFEELPYTVLRKEIT